MDDISNIMSLLVHLSRLALSGRRQDVQMIIRRIARQSRESFPNVASDLNTLLRDTPTPSNPLRNATAAAIPVDKDTRFGLIRVEYPVRLDIAPVWPIEIESQLDLIVSEQQAVNQLDNAGLLPTRSLLFTGLPGVGKTLAARWLASKLDLPLFILDLSAVMSSFLGRTGTNIRNVFDYAKGTKCILLLDELDAIAKRRDDLTEIGELKRLVTVILQEVDDWPAGGLLVAATNHSNLLDPAVWRRFEMVLEFPMPNLELTRQTIVRYLGKESESVANIVEPLSLSLLGESFSEIERAVSKMRRESVVTATSINNIIEKWIGERSILLPRNKKIELAAKLSQTGASQRAVNRLTGVSRDTLRKHHLNSQKQEEKV